MNAFLDELGRIEFDIDQAQSIVLEMRQSDADRGLARDELTELSRRIGQCEEAFQIAQRELASRRAELDPMLERQQAGSDAALQAAPRMRRAELARQFATMAENSVRAAAPAHFDRFAHAVTAAYRRLSHKADVANIIMAPDGTVMIMDGSGRDISDLRRSAGESQLLAMALIAAVSEIVGPALPLIVDTPFGRLDTKHRELALAMLSDRSGQTILLVQPEEMGPVARQRIQNKIAGEFEITYRDGSAGSIGTSVVRDGALAA